MTWNTANLARSTDRETELEGLLDDVNPDIVVLTETELPVTDVTFSVKNYTVYLPVSVMNKHRLVLLVKQPLIPLCNPTIIHKSHLDVWLKLSFPTGPLVVAGVYRQWSQNEVEDLGIVHGHAASVASSFGRAILLGDLNLDMGKAGDKSYYRHSLLQDHLDALEGMGFNFEGPNSPTFYSYGSFLNADGNYSQKSSTLDHIYGMGVDTKEVRTLSFAATDHRPIIASFQLSAPRPGVRQVRKRDYKAISSGVLLMAINAEELSKVFLHDDVNVIHVIVVKQITLALDKVAPYKSTTVKNRPTPLHLKPDTLRAMEERDQASKGKDHVKYKQLRNKAVRLLRRDKLDSAQHTLEKSGYDPKKVWELVNGATGRGGCSQLPAELKTEDGTVISGNKELANHVNRYYVDKIFNLRSRISRTTGTGNQKCSDADVVDVDELQLRPPSVGEVRKEIRRLKNTGAEGVDCIPTSVLKMGADVLAGPVAHLIAVSLRTAKVPDGFKKANIVPVHKKKKPADSASSYRPVSLLPALSKVLERIVHKQLMAFMEEKLPNSQHGFRPRRDTVGAIVAAHGDWMGAKSRSEIVGIAAYDLSSAFDTIDHDRLVDKLRSLGVRGKSVLWFADYLANRSQRVLYNGEYSTFKDLKFGVPQGSILGPLLFLCLLVDLPSIISSASSSSSNVGSSGYADDIVVWSAAKEADVVCRDLEQISAVICDFMADNFLVLNNDKTQVLWVGDEGRAVKVGSVTVAPSNRVDLLGVAFDRRLSPAPHLDGLIRAAHGLVGASSRLARHLRGPVLRQVVRALLVGRVGYGCAVLKPRLKETDPQNMALRKIQIAINNCARSILGSRRSDMKPVEELLRESGLPSLNRLIVESVALETWKGMNYTGYDGSKIPIGDILCPPQTGEKRVTRSVTSNCIPPPTKFRADTFAWTAYLVWNSSPELRSAHTVSLARKSAKELASTCPL